MSSYKVDVVGVESGNAATLQSLALDKTVQGAVGAKGKLAIRSTNSVTCTTASLHEGEEV